MKRMTASDVRKNWFRVLDEVASGEVVVVERNGRTVVLRCEKMGASSGRTTPDYRQLLTVPDPDRADRWGWEWREPEQDIVPVDREET